MLLSDFPPAHVWWEAYGQLTVCLPASAWQPLQLVARRNNSADEDHTISAVVQEVPKELNPKQSSQAQLIDAAMRVTGHSVQTFKQPPVAQQLQPLHYHPASCLTPAACTTSSRCFCFYS